MSRRLPATATPLEAMDVALALARCWRRLTGELPGDALVRMLVAQSALETGWWKQCRGFNLGNIKSTDRDGRDYAFFACNEVLEQGLAARIIVGAPLREDGGGKSAAVDHEATQRRLHRLGHDDGQVVVQFWPPHPACRFRAFSSIEEGMADHVEFLRGSARFVPALAAAAQGDVRGFVAALKAGRYFTADASVYHATLVGVIAQLGSLPWQARLEEQDRRDAEAALAIGFLTPVDLERPDR